MNLTPDEQARKDMVDVINPSVAAMGDDARSILETEHGQVWDTKQLQEDFIVTGFAAPFTIVTRKSDGKKGALMFSHRPRFYFAFKEC
jgi:hypothetical protein